MNDPLGSSTRIGAPVAVRVDGRWLTRSKKSVEPESAIARTKVVGDVSEGGVNEDEFAVKRLLALQHETLSTSPRRHG